MKKCLLFLSMAIVAVLFSSCATIFSGSSQAINFSSEPQGAIVTVDGKQLGKTPFSAEIKKKNKTIISLTKDGYEEKNIELKGNFNATSLLGVFLDFGILSIPIDFVTGAAWKYNNNSAYAQLVPTNGYTPQAINQNTPIIKKVIPATTGYEQKVAVFDPTGKDISSDIIIIVREEVSNAVVNTQGYTVLEREQIDRVLAENKFQASGQVDDKQIGALGRKMGADKVCVTSVTKLGNSYHISCKLVDVTTAQIETQKTGKTVAGGSNIDEIVAEIVSTMLR